MPSTPDRWIRLWYSLSGKRLAREIQDEMEFHLEMRTREYVLQGLSPAAARQKAEARFGDVEGLRRRTVRDGRWRLKTKSLALFLDGMRQDLRFAFRRLLKRPGFSLVALGVLAGGIGASAAIFNIVYSLLLRPMPFPHPERIFQIWESRAETGWQRALLTQANFWDLRDMNGEFEDVGAIWQGYRNLTDGETAVRVLAGNVSPGFFGTVLGVQAVLGRTLLAGDGNPEVGSRAVLLGNRFWHDHFGGDPLILGGTLTLDGAPFTVVGVLPPGRPWLGAGDVFLAYARDPAAPRTGFDLGVIGRLREGVSAEEGLADLQRMASRLEAVYPDALAGIGFTMSGVEDWGAPPTIRRALWVLLGSVSLLFLIACVNAATMFLVRATGRVQETAIRAAAGAGRGRLIRETLTESLLLSLLGSGLGFVLAVGGTKALKALGHGQIPGISLVEINGWILAFTLAAGVGTGFVTGLVPALQIGGGDTAQTLRSGGTSATGNRRLQRSRHVLVASEVALSILLLVGAGLLGRSLWQLMRVDPGFEVENRLVASVSFPQTFSPAEMVGIMERFSQGASSLPEIRSAAGSNNPPLSEMSPMMGITTEGGPAPEGEIPLVVWRLITPGYFRTLGAHLLQGRDFDSEEMVFEEGGRIPVILSRSVGQILWPGEDPLGRAVVLWGGQEELTGTVVGVVEELYENGIDVGPTSAVYLPYWTPRSPNLVFHTVGDPWAVVPALKFLLAEIDPGLPLSGVTTLEGMVGRSVASQRSTSILLGLFASAALLLALVGVYGVQAYTVALLTREIGVRMAMGASPGLLLIQTMLEGVRPVAAGVLAGLLGALGLSRLLAGSLYEVAPMDLLTYLGALGLFVVTALVAIGLAARRVVGVDPALAFRAE